MWHKILDPAPVSIVVLAANPQIDHANMPSPQSEIERYLRSGEARLSDPLKRAGADDVSHSQSSPPDFIGMVPMRGPDPNTYHGAPRASSRAREEAPRGTLDDLAPAIPGPRPSSVLPKRMHFRFARDALRSNTINSGAWESGITRFMNWSKRGTVKAVSPCCGL